MKLKKDKGIASLIIVLVIGLFALALALTVTGQMVAEIVKGTNTISGDRSFHTAEAASREGAYQHIKNSLEGPHDFPVSINTIPESAISFEISDSSPDGPCKEFYWACKDIEGKSQHVSYRNVKSTLLLDSSVSTFGYAVYVNGGLTFLGGAGVTIDGDVFASGDIDCKGNLTNTEGFYSQGDITGGCGDEENRFEKQNKIDPPTINLEEYYNIAEDEGTVFNDNSEFESYVDDRDGKIDGIMYIKTITDKNHTLSYLDSLKGTLIIEEIIDKESIRINGGKYEADSENYDQMAIIIKNGGLDLGGNVTIEGIIYVEGKIKFTGGGEKDKVNIKGSIISTESIEEDTTVGGSVNIEYVSLTGPPLGYIANPENPKIVSWREE